MSKRRKGRRKKRRSVSLRFLFVLVFLACGVFIQENQSDPNRKLIIWKFEIEKTSHFIQCADEIDKYIHNNFPKSKLTGTFVLRECYRYKVDPVFVLAQGVVESGLGTFGSSKTTNNVWNVGHYDGMSTKDVMRSKYHYKTQNQSIIPYLKLLKRSYLGKYKTERHLMRNFVTHSGKRYASNPTYESQLRATYNKILHSTKIDQYYGELVEIYENR